jgi:glucosamine-phosphate N-acetyltransferase
MLNNTNIGFRNIVKNDYNEYIKLINSNISRKHYDNFIDNVLGNDHQIIVLEIENKLIGTGTLLIEEKLTHGGSKMGHIENILIYDEFRGKGMGEQLVNELLKRSKENKCYRVDLVCEKELEKFYIKNNFNADSISMSILFKENFK